MAKPDSPETFQNKAGRWHYRIKGRNGEKMITSQSYPTQQHAVRGFADLQERINDFTLGSDMDDEE